ncbi:MAG: cadmium-translocating P-type ATPase [Desulfurococcales archaeon]|nr:cadmium-translocating P-type ATPase [Desulfurococcales archaeon]
MSHHSESRGELAWYAALAASATTGLAASLAGSPGPARAALAAGAALLAARFALALARGRFTVDLLMAVVGLVAVRHGLVLEGLIVYLLYSAAEALEERVEALARRRLEAAARLLPGRVLVERPGGGGEVEVESLQPGDVVVARVGEALPADGTALSPGAVDASIVTGEPDPVEVRPGDRLPSGVVVVEGPIRVRVERPPGDSYAQRLISEALEALEERPRVTRTLERLAPLLTAVVLSAFAAAHLALGPARALSVLLAGCPSAFIIASSFQASYQIAGLARRGVLVRGGASLEAASTVDTVVVDKTGTLTTLAPAPVDGDPRAWRLAGLAAALARGSRHPVARALAAMPAPGGASVSWVREERGSGVVGEVSGSLVELRAGPPMPCGKTVLVRASTPGGGVEEAVLCLRETLAAGARELVAYLRGRGVRVVIASGDRPENVRRVAEELGVEEYHANMSPEAKAELVRRLRGEGRRVAFVGDGVNDAIALAAADFSVAVGSVDLTRELADAVAPHGPRQVLEVFRAAHAFRRGLAAAFATAALAKLAVATAGLAGLMPLPLVALLGDDGSTLAAAAAGALAGGSRGRP